MESLTIYLTKIFTFHMYHSEGKRTISKDLLTLEQKDLIDYPESLRIVNRGDKEKKKECEQAVKPQTKRLNSSLLPRLKSFFDQVSKEKEEEELQIGEPTIDDKPDTPQVQLSVMFCELPESEEKILGSDSASSSDSEES